MEVMGDFQDLLFGFKPDPAHNTKLVKRNVQQIADRQDILMFKCAQSLGTETE